MDQIQNENNLKEIIILLNHGNHNQRLFANQTLFEFIEIENSWNILINLLTIENDSFIQFFISNLILTKVKKYFKQLNNSQRNELCLFLKNYLINISNNYIQQVTNSLKVDIKYLRALANRISLIYGSVCCQEMSIGISTYIETSFEFINVQSSSSFDTSFVCCIGLDMISLAPEFINELDLSRQHRLELNQQIKILQSKVYENITTLTSTSSSITESITISILRTLRAWIPIGISLTLFCQQQANLLQFIISVLNTKSSQCLREVFGFISDLCLVGENPRPTSRNECLEFIISQIINSLQNSIILQLISNPDIDEDAINDICCSLSTFAEKEVIYIFTNLNESNLQFIELLFHLTSIRPCKIALHTYDFWLSIENIPNANNLIPSNIFEKLLSILVQQCQLSQELIELQNQNEIEDDDVDNILEFRNSQGTEDVFNLCLKILGSRQFFYCISLVIYPHINSSISEHNLNSYCEQSLQSYPPTWISLDVSLYVVMIIMDNIKIFFQQLINQSITNEYFINSIYSLILVYELLKHIIFHSSSLNNFPILLQETCCKFIGCCTFLITSHSITSSFNFIPLQLTNYGILDTLTGPSNLIELMNNFCNLFESSIDTLFKYLENNLTTTIIHSAASKSLLQLCTHGSFLFHNPSSPLIQSQFHLQIISRFSQLISNSIQQLIPSLIIIQTVCQIISGYSLNDAISLFNIIGDPIKSILFSEINNNNNDNNNSWINHSNKIILLLKEITLIIRYSPVITSSSELSENQSEINCDSHITIFLSDIWSSIDIIFQTCCSNQLHNNSNSSSNKEIINNILELYKQGLITLPHIFLQYDIMKLISFNCVTSFCDKNIPLGASCLRCLVECSSSSSSSSSTTKFEYFLNNNVIVEQDSLLLEILSHIINTTFHSLQSLQSNQWPWIQDPNGIELLFQYIYQYFLSCPQIIYSISKQNELFIQMIIHIAFNYLNIFKSENDVIRRILQVLQSCITPPISIFLNINPTNIIAIHYEYLFKFTFQYIDEFISFIFNSLTFNEIQQTLWSNINDLFYNLCLGCLEFNEKTKLITSLESYLLNSDYNYLEEEIQQQNEPKDLELLNQINPLFRFLKNKERQFILNLLIYMSEKRNQKRFKSLVFDIAKICRKELDPSALEDYEFVMSFD